MRKYILVIILSCLYLGVASAQSVGIRAGLNFTRFAGPIEAGAYEQYSLTNGFHFGFNYAYKFSRTTSLRAELLYTQIGTQYDFIGYSYYKIPLGATGFVYKKGVSDVSLKVSNAYVSLPITFQWQATKKFEFYGGGYVGFLVSPRGQGTMEFVHNVDSLFFRQSLVHNYYSDKAGAAATANIGPSVWVDGTVVTLARDAGAYYNLNENEKTADLYRTFDYGLTGGVNFYINRGLYIGCRFIYGMRDVTNNKVDFLRTQYDEENNLDIRSNHFDRNLGYEFSIGFKF